MEKQKKCPRQGGIRRKIINRLNSLGTDSPPPPLRKIFSVGAIRRSSHTAVIRRSMHILFSPGFRFGPSDYDRLLNALHGTASRRRYRRRATRGRHWRRAGQQTRARVSDGSLAGRRGCRTTASRRSSTSTATSPRASRPTPTGDAFCLCCRRTRRTRQWQHSWRAAPPSCSASSCPSRTTTLATWGPSTTTPSGSDPCISGAVKFIRCVSPLGNQRTRSWPAAPSQASPCPTPS